MKKNNFTKLASTYLFAILVAASMTTATRVYAQSNGLVTVQSKMSFDQTVGGLKKGIAKNGMMVMSEINQGKMLAMTGIKLKAVSLFVGNPTVGNKLFSADRAVGFVVPIRVNVYDDANGNTYISYVKPSAQLSTLGNKKVDMIAQMLDQKLQMLTGMFAK